MSDKGKALKRILAREKANPRHILYGKTTPGEKRKPEERRYSLGQSIYDDEEEEETKKYSLDKPEEKENPEDILYNHPTSQPKKKGDDKIDGMQIKDKAKTKEEEEQELLDLMYNHPTSQPGYRQNSKNCEYEEDSDTVVINNVKYPKKTDNPEIQKIKERGISELSKIESERKKERNKNIAGALMIAGSSFIPGGKETKISAAAIKVLAPKLGKLTAEKVVKNAVKNSAAGAVAGTGNAIINDENPAKSVVAGAAFGGVAGGTGGGIEGILIKKI